MLKAFALALLLVSGSAYASVPPFPAPSIHDHKSHSGITQKHANNQHSATDNSSLPVTIKGQVEIEKTANERVYERQESNESASIENGMESWTEILTIATILLGVITCGLVYLGIRQERALKNIERAYIKISHSTGIEWFENDGSFLLPLKITNKGNTPADITDVVIRPCILNDGDSLPDIPPYKRQRTTNSFHAFLVKNDYFFYNNPELFTIRNEKTAILNGTKILYILAYVDYIDKFGIRHRSGYARKLDPRAPIEEERSNNLIFETKKGYNYDRKRKRGEGNDW